MLANGDPSQNIVVISTIQSTPGVRVPRVKVKTTSPRDVFPEALFSFFHTFSLSTFRSERWPTALSLRHGYVSLWKKGGRRGLG